MSIRHILPLAAALLMSVAAMAQEPAYQAPEVQVSKDKVRVNGVAYYAHVVKTRQTLFSIAKAYGVSVEEIYDANTNIDLRANGPKVGQVIFIPTVSRATSVMGTELQHAQAGSAGEQVGSAETQVGAGSVQISSGEVQVQAASADTTAAMQVDSRALFPGLREMLGQIFGLQQDSSFVRDIPETIEVAVLLPFNANSSKPDSRSLDFYAGALLAARDLGASGLKMRINAYDVNAGGISSVMLSSSDVILGPITVKNLETAAMVCPSGKYIISPLEPKAAALTANQRIVQAPSAASAQHADMVRWALEDMAPEDSLVVVRQRGEAAGGAVQDILEELRFSGRRFHTITYELVQGMKVQDSFVAHSSKEGTTRYIIASENESFINDAVRNMNLMAYKQQKVALYAPARLRGMSTVETENLHNVNTHISATYNVDYTNEDVKEFVMAYRALFGAEPNSFAFHGYDCMHYFVGICSKYGRNWAQKLSEYSEKGLQTSFRFDPAEQTPGKNNSAVRRIVYTPEFKIVAID